MLLRDKREYIVRCVMRGRFWYKLQYFLLDTIFVIPSILSGQTLSGAKDILWRFSIKKYFHSSLMIHYSINILLYMDRTCYNGEIY